MLIKTKELLKNEFTKVEIKNTKDSYVVVVRPILHNDDCIILQFNGWSINLYNNGTWIWEDTTGG